MEMVKVESSTIDSIGFDNDTLYVKFNNGRTYTYLNVSKEVFTEMLNAPSKGIYLNQKIKSNYEFKKI